MQAAIASADQGFRQRLPHLGMFGLVVAYASLLVMTSQMGIWLIDAEGQHIATDFINVWAAGKLVLQGVPADAYDWTIHKSVEVIGAGRDFPEYFGWHYPPPFLLVAAPLAMLPYPAALLAWMAVSAPLYLAAMRLIAGARGTLLAALAWPVVFWNVVVGQNGFLTAALLGSGLALIEKRPALAGILIGLLTYKPQFGLLIPVALVAGGHWRVIGWAALSAVGLALASALVLGIQPWQAFLQSTAHTSEAVLVEGAADFAELQSLFGQVRAYGGGVDLAWIAQGALVAAMTAGLVWLWRSRADFSTKAAALAVMTLLASPYIYLYDLVALAIPLAFLGRTGFSIRETAVIILAGVLVAWGPADHLATGLAAALLVLGIVIARVRSPQDGDMDDAGLASGRPAKAEPRKPGQSMAL
jgi:hypothetical protein